MGSCYTPFLLWGFPGGVSGKNQRASAGDIRDSGLIPGSGRPPGGGHGNPLQCSCLENPMDRGAWRATVHGVAKSQTRLKWLSRHASSCMEKGQKLISGETSQLRNTRENCQKARGALRPEPQEKRWKGTWGLVWKEGDTEPGRGHGESGVLVHALWDVDPEHGSWGHIHHDSDRSVITPILQTRLEKLQQDYWRYATDSWQSSAKTQCQSQGLLSTQHCWLNVSRQDSEVQGVGPREADS